MEGQYSYHQNRNVPPEKWYILFYCHFSGAAIHAWRIKKSAENHSIFSALVTPVGFIYNRVKSFVYQYVRILENHGCSLFAHPEISMFFVYLQRKDSYNSLISARFQC